jgi:hypothetical protein
MKVLKRLACFLLLLLFLAGTCAQPADAQTGCYLQTFCFVSDYGTDPGPYCTICWSVLLCYDLCGDVWTDLYALCCFYA